MSMNFLKKLGVYLLGFIALAQMALADNVYTDPGTATETDADPAVVRGIFQLPNILKADTLP